MLKSMISELISIDPSQLFIDKIIDIEVGQRITTQKNLSYSDPCFQSSTDSTLPPSRFLDMISQSATALLNSKKDLSGQKNRLKTLEKLALIGSASPGDVCRIEVNVLKHSEERVDCEAYIYVDGQVIVEARFSMAISAAHGQVNIHPTASVHPSAVLGKDVSIGPYSIIGEDVHIGDRTVIDAHVLIEKWCEIGADNHIYFGSVIGSNAQDARYEGERSTVKIGDGNEIREYVTINRSTGEGTETRVGSNNMFLVNVHIGHNASIGDNVVLANLVHVGGHVRIDDGAIIGGLTGIHQFVRVGTGVMAGGYSRLIQDIPPYMLCDGNPAMVRNLNIVGLKRRGISMSDLKALKQGFKSLYREGMNVQQTLEACTPDPNNPYLDAFLHFLSEESNRGINQKYEAGSDNQ